MIYNTLFGLKHQLNAKLSINEHSNHFAPCKTTSNASSRTNRSQRTLKQDLYGLKRGSKNVHSCCHDSLWRMSPTHTQPTDRSPPPPPASTHKNAAYPQPEKHSAPSRRNFNLLLPCWSHKLRQEGGSLFCLILSNRVNGQGHGGWLGGY